MTIAERILSLGVLIAVPLILIGVPVFYLTGGSKKTVFRRLQRRFARLKLHEFPQTGDVLLVYHTYHGFLVWGVMSEVRINAPPDDARVLLGRLLRLNLTWGMIGPAALFVLFLAIGNYRAQTRSIERQESILHVQGTVGGDAMRKET